MAGLVAPDRYPIRDPRSTKKNVGRIVQGTNYFEMGGAKGPGIVAGAENMATDRPGVAVGRRAKKGE